MFTSGQLLFLGLIVLEQCIRSASLVVPLGPGNWQKIKEPERTAPMTSYPCNRRRVFNACALTLAALTLGACAPAGESRQRKSSLPTDDTDQEHAQCIEALDKSPKLWMPELIRATPLSEMRWLDNCRMVLSVRELPG